VSVLIYVEGGGDQEALRIQLRQGFHKFLQKALPGKPRPRCIPWKGRDQTYQRFRAAVHECPGDTVILLVDSEEAVGPGDRAWAHLKKRDRWDQPAGTTQDQAHLMVQCMEAWFLADKEALAAYYGQGSRSMPKPCFPTCNR
jgi:Domain of unknown function (DUF4276)